MRTGEAAALRWRHYSPEVRPLGKLLVARSYNTKRNREKNTKTEAVKHVPVHPTLAAMLAEWKLGGWPAMYGRAPGPDDLIVPLPPEAADRRVSRAGEPFRGNTYSGTQWRRRDLPARLAVETALRHEGHLHHAGDRRRRRRRRHQDPHHAHCEVPERVRRLQPGAALGADLR